MGELVRKSWSSKRETAEAHLNDLQTKSILTSVDEMKFFKKMVFVRVPPYN